MTMLAEAAPPAGSISTTSPPSLFLRFAPTDTPVDASTLSVHVDDVRVVSEGALDPEAAGWAAVVTDTGDEVEVTLTPPGPWSAGDRVVVRAQVDGIELGYFFDVVDVRGPQVVNIAPVEGARGLNLTADLAFDITSSVGVDTATLNVEVNGAAAITAGAGVGDWSTSTVSPVADGQRVTLKKPSGYVDGEIVFVDIQVSDSDGRAGERRVLRFHFGTTTNDAVVNMGLAGEDIVRVMAFDFSDTSFGDPVRLRHTGFAYDGYWYDDGNKTADIASWFTELGEFPVSGHVVVTATNGWSIIRALGAGPWMTCVPAASPAWSMADNDAGPIRDADFGPDACLVLAGNNVLFIDFVEDRAERANTAGMTRSSGTVSERNSDQSGGAPDAAYKLPVGPHTHVAMVRQQTDDGRQMVAIVANPSGLSLVTSLSSNLVARLKARDGTTLTPATVVTRSVPGAVARLRAAKIVNPDVITPFVVAFNDAGQGQVELWDWFAFGLFEASSLFLDDASSPALPASEVRDLDMVMSQDHLVLAAAMVGRVVVVDVDPADPTSASAAEYTEADLGLSGVVGAEISALALEPDFHADVGHLYAAVSTAADGRVTRFRVHAPGAGNRAVTVASGQPFTTLSAIGSTKHFEETYIHTSMSIE